MKNRFINNMKITLLSIMFLCLSAAAFSQTPVVNITEGNFSITGHSGGEAANNATIKTDIFSATSNLGGQYSPWYDICLTSPNCTPGSTFAVPKYSRVSLGGCVGDCYQFIGGPFTIGGETYQNAYFRGYFDFSRETFTIPKMNRRRGTVVFRKPFTLSGQLHVCRVMDFNNPCPQDQVLFNGAVQGHGTLTVTLTFKTAVGLRDYPVPYLFQQRFEYRFEP